MRLSFPDRSPSVMDRRGWNRNNRRGNLEFQTPHEYGAAKCKYQERLEWKMRLNQRHRMFRGFNERSSTVARPDFAGSMNHFSWKVYMAAKARQRTTKRWHKLVRTLTWETWEGGNGGKERRETELFSHESDWICFLGRRTITVICVCWVCGLALSLEYLHPTSVFPATRIECALPLLVSPELALLPASFCLHPRPRVAHFSTIVLHMDVPAVSYLSPPRCCFAQNLQ